MKFKGEVWRHVPRGAFGLHAGFILSAAGRWNRPGIYGCLYTSLTQEGAEAEFLKYISRSGILPAAIAPRDLVTIKVELQPVMDLTASNPLVDPAEEFLTGDRPNDWENCRAIADLARQQKYTGLLVPSAALKGARNLVIYIDGRAGFIKLDTGSTRLPLRPDRLLS